MQIKVEAKPSSPSSNNSLSDSSGPAYTHTRTYNVIQAIYDWQNNLIEINMNRTKLHAILFNVLTICLPYQPNMYKLTLKGEGLTGQMVHNLTHVLRNSHITSIHISYTRVPEQNFYELVETFSNLSQLLLCMCSINDDSLKLIMDHCKTNSVLNILDFTSNNITDVGASHISDMLRFNRSLYYLSLADNKISDAGCFEILRVLVPFHLTADEVKAVRGWNLECLVMMTNVDEATTQNRVPPPSEVSQRGRRQKRSEALKCRGRSARKASPKAKPIPDEAKPAPDKLKIKVNCPDDASFKETIFRNGHVYSVGNRSLSRLNMAYNQVAYPVLLRVLEVFNEQMELGNKCEKSGLSHVLLDGNNLPGGGATLYTGGGVKREGPTRPRGLQSKASIDNISKRPVQRANKGCDN